MRSIVSSQLSVFNYWTASRRISSHRIVLNRFLSTCIFSCIVSCPCIEIRIGSSLSWEIYTPSLLPFQRFQSQSVWLWAPSLHHLLASAGWCLLRWSRLHTASWSLTRVKGLSQSPSLLGHAAQTSQAWNQELTTLLKSTLSSDMEERASLLLFRWRQVRYQEGWLICVIHDWSVFIKIALCYSRLICVIQDWSVLLKLFEAQH